MRMNARIMITVAAFALLTACDNSLSPEDQALLDNASRSAQEAKAQSQQAAQAAQAAQADAARAAADAAAARAAAEQAATKSDRIFRTGQGK